MYNYYIYNLRIRESFPMYNKKVDNKFHLFSKEVKLLKDAKTITRTDTKGNILYFNHTFSNISGYTREELMRVPHSILRHPDMPKTIFYLIWKSLLAGHDTNAIIKNMTKEGNYYWQKTKFHVQKDNQNRTISFLSEGTQTQKEEIKKIEPLYKELLEIEQYDTDNAIRFFLDFLNANNIATYNDYILRIENNNKKSSFFSSWLKF